MKITEELCNKIAKMWGGRKYQTWHEEKHRIKHVQSVTAPLLKGMTVLDIGCNAGLQCLALSDYVERYIGLEADEMFYNQFQQTVKHVPDGIPIECFNMTFGKYIEKNGVDFNAVFASYVLYHLSDAELAVFRDDVLPKCKLAVVYTRNKPRDNEKNSYKLWDSKNVIKFLKSAGFTNIESQFKKNGFIHVSIATR
jgi:cyclopropane fatty-acyl-phospholipid synthase-like methyltransferase